MRDVDLFKEINDVYGHAVGDKVLKQVGKILRGTFRGSDILGRIGGDEFVIIQSSIGEPEFHNRINRLQEYMKQDQISISIGFLWKASCENLEDMLKEADHRMYEAKKTYYQTADRRTHNH